MTRLAIDGLSKTYADGTEALRDIHIVTQHQMVNRNVFETTGRLLLGMATESFFL